METKTTPITLIKPSTTQAYKQPLVIGVSAGILGFCIGSGRWQWLKSGSIGLSNSLVHLLSTYAVHAFKTKNPELFSKVTPIQ